ncbi:MAG: ATP-binding protein [Verrucomicrobiales bacterium]|nr:ATP-binding protein [Verrucomicrobiales bacterium]
MCAAGLAFPVLPIPATDPGFDPTDPTMEVDLLFQRRVFTRADGLPSDNVRALHVSRDGTLWIGTDRGLSRLANGGFQTFNHASDPIFRHDTVTAIEEGTDGTLWVGTLDGLLEFNAKATRRHTTAEGLVDNQIEVLKARRNGELWFGTYRGLHRLANGKVTAFPNVFTNSSTARPAVFSMIEDRAGRFWVTGPGTPAQLLDASSDRFSPVSIQGNFTNALQSAFVAGHGILEDAAGRIWISGTPSFYLDSTGWHRPPPDDPLGRGCGSFLGLDADGTFWLREWDTGLVAYRAGRTRIFSTLEGVPDMPIQTLVIDRLGALWFGTPSGLCRWLPRRFPRVIGGDLLPKEAVWTMTEDSEGVAWIGTDRGVFRRDPSGRIDTPIRSLSDHRIRSLHLDQQGTLWIGTMDSLEFWRDAKLNVHHWEAPETHNKVRVVTSDAAGRLWVGRERGLMCRAGDVWRQFRVADGLPHDDVRALRFDRAGNLWIGTFGGGLAVADIGLHNPRASLAPPPRLEILAVRSRTNGLPSDYVWAIHEDARGSCWLGTDRGLARVHPAPRFEVSAITQAHGLFEEAINEILADDSGALWLSTERGFGRIDLDQAHAVADGRAPQLDCLAFTEADGLLTGESNGQKSQPAGIKTRDGRLWFATPRGICHFNPTNISARIRAPAPLLDQIRVDHETVYQFRPGIPQPGEHRFEFEPGRARLLEIAYANPEFREGPPPRFRHRLIGFDDRWVQAGERQFAIFTNLKPGAYQFEVQSAANHSAWSDHSVRCHIVIRPWFYQTLWFRTCLVGSLLAATFGTIRWREHSQHRVAELRRQMALTEERHRIARDVHDEVGSGLLRLAILGEKAQDRRDPNASVADLDRVRGEAHRLVDQLGDLIWAINPENDSLDQVLARLREYAALYVQDACLEGDLVFPDLRTTHLKLSGFARRNLALAFKEALCNAVKHAEASRVDVRCDLDHDHAWLTISVIDNGRGFDPARRSTPSKGGGHGLAGMRHRLDSVGGHATIESQIGQGTHVTLALPLPT